MKPISTSLPISSVPLATHTVTNQTRFKIATRRGFRRAVTASFLGLALLVIGCGQPAVGPEHSLEAFTNHLDERVPRLMARYNVPGVSMALVQNGEIAWSGAYGYADRERGRTMTTDAVFRAESISKPVTAWGVMRLVEQSQVELDAPVEQYLSNFALPESRYDERKVTTRRLLSNSAGLPLGTLGEEYAPGSDMPSLREYLSREARLTREPGAEFEYSNVGFNALELLVEETTGRDFAAYMADEILMPLGMNRSYFAWNEGLHSSIPMGYDLQGVPVPPYVYPTNASGGLFATADDIARFVGAGMTGSYAEDRAVTTDHAVLNRESIRLLHTPQVDIPGLFGFVADAYGLGHFIETLPDGRRAVWHGGQGHGVMTHFHAVPATGDGIVLLTNSQRSWPLLAEILRDWAWWSGFGAVKFGRIAHATTALWIVVSLILLASLGQAYRLTSAWRRSQRRWAPLSSAHRGKRLVQAALAIGLMAVLAWSVAQPYLFVSSIFPTVARWAGWSMLIAAIIMGLSALVPRVEDRVAR